MLCEDAAAEGLNLAEGNGSHPGSFETEGEAADSTEQIKDIHASPTIGLFMVPRL